MVRPDAVGSVVRADCVVHGVRSDTSKSNF
jgi:hypothetical protein